MPASAEDSPISVLIAADSAPEADRLEAEAESEEPYCMFYEEFEPGDVFRTDGVTLTESSIIDFAVQYDPQRFHVAREAAGESIYGGIIASGWQVCSLGFRMVAQANFLGSEAMGSPGLDTLRWRKPVRPGDTIRVKARVIEKRPSTSRDDRGYVTFEFDTQNQDGDVVMSYTVIEILRRRPAET